MRGLQRLYKGYGSCPGCTASVRRVWLLCGTYSICTPATASERRVQMLCATYGVCAPGYNIYASRTAPVDSIQPVCIAYSVRGQNLSNPIHNAKM